ncbi:tetratricopeptide repeat protein [Cerasicoccus arenae]|nr:hypothetical protein [Cerasicoccus arenae]MBK1859055.1 hypothetical protein [Cerasicoccus arenae]
MSPQAKRRLIIGGAVLTVLLVATPFAWREFKQQRAINLAEDARILLEDEEYGAAWEAAKAAYALDPKNIEVARTLANIVDLAEPNKAPALWEGIYELSGEKADLLAWFDSVMRLENKADLARMTERLATDLPDASEALHRRAQSAIIHGQLEEGIQLSQQAAQAADASADIQFAYVQISQRSSDAEVREAGLVWLRQMAQRSDSTGLKAARWLLKAPNTSRDQLIEAAEKLANHPLAEREDMLTEIVIRRSTGEQSMEELLADAQALFTLDDPAELVELGRWLNLQRRSSDFLALVDFETAISRRDLFLVWVDSMAYSGQWEALQQIIERPRLPLDPFTIVLFRARIQDELGNDRVSNLIWGQAILAAKEDVHKLTFAYDYASKLNWNEKARDVLERLALLPMAQRKAYEKIIELDQSTGDMTAMRDALRRMAKKYPNDVSVANDLAYTNLLMGEDIEASAETAYRLLQESERPYLANLMTLALAHYQAGRSDLALEQLYPLAIDWSEVRPGWRAIYAAILAANGHDKESQYIMNGVNPDDLLPPEREILKNARK